MQMYSFESIWGKDIACAIFTFLEQDSFLFSMLVLSKQCHSNITGNYNLWIMLAERNSCFLCFLEARKHAGEYVSNGLESSKYWKDVCKAFVAAKSLRR